MKESIATPTGSFANFAVIKIILASRLADENFKSEIEEVCMKNNKYSDEVSQQTNWNGQHGDN